MESDPKAKLDDALEQYKAEQLEEAERLWEELLEDNPSNPEALYRLGLAAYRGGDNGRAVELISKAIRAEPENARLYNGLGRALAALGRHREALASHRRAISIDGEYSDAHNNLGRSLKALGRMDAAIAAYRRAIALDPNNAEAHNNLGNALIAEGASGEAVAALERALALRPRYAKARNNLGIARLDRGELEDAAELFREALEIDPDYAEAHNNLGAALEALRRLEEAAAAFRAALEIRPDYVSAHVNLARVHRHDEGDPAIARLEALVDRAQLSAAEGTDLRFALAKAYDDTGRFDQAFARFREANARMAEGARYDPAAHRRLVEGIKKTFRHQNEMGGDRGASGTPSRTATPIFVLGLSRSGKSLVESLLARHPEVGSGGERREWVEAMDEVLARHRVRTPYPACVERLTDVQVDEIGGAYLEAMARRLPPCRVFVDTMAGNVAFVGLILRALPAARVVACEREAMDNCLAIYFTRYRSGHDYAYDLRHIAAYYRAHAELVAHWQTLFGERVLRLAYEDLVGAPVETRARLDRHAGLDPGAAMAHPGLTAGAVGHARHYTAHLGPLRTALGEATSR